MFAKIRFYWGAFVISFVVAAIMIPMIYIFPEKKGTIMHRLNRVILTLLGAKLKKEGENLLGLNDLLLPCKHKNTP